MLKDTLQNSNTVTKPEEEQEKKNDGDAGGRYANKGHQTRVLPLRALEETRWNSLYYNAIAQSHLLLSDFLALKNSAIYCDLQC